MAPLLVELRLYYSATERLANEGIAAEGGRVAAVAWRIGAAGFHSNRTLSTLYKCADVNLCASSSGGRRGHTREGRLQQSCRAMMSAA